VAESASPASEARSILITGSSSGIGRATAERFASRGWRVFASMRNPGSEGGVALRARAAEAGWRLTTPALDVTSDESAASATSEVLHETGGRLDVLVNNAGYYAFGPLEETAPDELRALLETNVVGVLRVTRAVLPAMRARRAGTVVTLGSVSGRVATPIGGPYHASKWALEGMIESLRLEMIPFAVRVVLIEPGPYHTALHDNERLAAGAGRADSPYADLLASYRRQAAKLPRQEDLGPLIDVIERAATSENPRLRWPVGPTSLTGGRLRAFVPDRLYEWLMRVAFPIRSKLEPSKGSKPSATGSARQSPASPTRSKP
jgi:NAD(P)-dependent dehydrogenase (short-subunit alcohol dehydrogenase family)